MQEFAARLLNSDGPAPSGDNDAQSGASGSDLMVRGVLSGDTLADHGLGARGHRQCLLPLTDRDRSKIQAMLRSEVIQVINKIHHVILWL